MKINYEQVVLDFLGSLAPEPRFRVRRALRALERGAGDIRALGGKLLGYHRLRVLSYRVIFQYVKPDAGGRQLIRCVFAAQREVVYDEFGERLRSKSTPSGDAELAS